MIDYDDVDADFGADAKVDSQPGFLDPAWSSLVAAYRQLTKVAACWITISIIHYHFNEP